MLINTSEVLKKGFGSFCSKFEQKIKCENSDTWSDRPEKLQKHAFALGFSTGIFLYL